MDNVDVHIKKVGTQADILVVRVRGPLDTVASYTFHEKMNNFIAQGNYKFIIDLAELEYITSAGIGVFPGVALELQKHQGGIMFMNVSEKTYKLFAMIGLTSIFKVAPNLEQALKEFEPA